MFQGDNRYFILNIMIAQIFFHLPKMMDDSTVLKEKFLEFIERAFCCQVPPCAILFLRLRRLVYFGIVTMQNSANCITI